jgi:hypothetical protein
MTKKGLTFKEFVVLARSEQLNILQRDGAHVGKRVDGANIVILFQLHSFYVEVYYEQYRKKVRDLVFSESADIVKPYLNQIRLDGLDGVQEGTGDDKGA